MTRRNVRLDDVRQVSKNVQREGFVTVPDADFVEIIKAAWLGGFLTGNTRATDHHMDLAWGRCEIRTILKDKGYDV